jgi:Rrf2 family protein
MFELTRKADYALRLMIEVAASGDGSRTTAEIAAREDIPYQFLRKVAQELVAAGLITSSRGAHGGLALAHPASTISLLEVVRAVHEPAISKCLIDQAACTRRSRCVIFPVWRRLQRDMERAMEAVTLSDLARRHRDVAVAASARGARAPEQAKWPRKETPKVSFQHHTRKSKVGITPERR